MDQNKTTHTIEIKSNKLLVFGGVYSNFQSLIAFKKEVIKQGFSPEQIICNGDIVGYCAQPEECLQKIKNWGIHNILGNVEIQLRDELEDCGCDFDNGSRCDIFSRQWFPFAQSKVSQNSLEWLRTIPDHLKINWGPFKLGIVHGAFDQTSQYVFESTDWSIKEEQLQNNGVDIIIGGHSGLPFHNQENNLHWINPGVIGMPANDGTSRVWYCILEIKDGTITVSHHSYEYDNEIASQLMNEEGLPKEYAKTLITGLWDNCEILPEKETNMQGVQLA